MLAPLQNNANKAPVSRSAFVPAPVAGWNAKDPLADMPPDSAVDLENMFPHREDVELRGGYESFATGIGAGAVETLVEWAGPSSRKLLAAGGTVIYDISSGGAGVSVATGKTNAKWQTTMFGTAGGNFLYFVNGADAPIYFDGSTFTTPSLTGVTPTDIIGVMAHQRRLFFVFNNSMSFGYLPVVSVAGAVSTLDIGGLCKKGGYIMAAGSWTRDGGSGADDLAAFITSEGEVVIYQGNDPSSATTWDLVGVFSMGKPIGRRCVEKIGSELVVITQDGFVELSKFLPIDRVGASSKALSDNIQNHVVDDTREHGTLYGWQSLHYPRGNYVLFNVPHSSTVSYQYVMNTDTRAWCSFKGQNAKCWALFGAEGDIYFGASSGGVVYKADTGTSDAGADINWKFKPAFNYFGQKGKKKLFTMFRPHFTANGSVDLAVDLNVDFSDVTPTSIPTESALGGMIWGTSNWGEANWTGVSPNAPWLTVFGIGNCASTTMRGATNSRTIKMNGWEMIWQDGNVL